jgi:hypothetical protein
MDELLRTNDLALLSYVEALLKEASIHYILADQGISTAEGSIGIFPRRVLVATDQAESARALMREAGLDRELRA